MTREVYCQKLDKMAEGLQRKPYPGPLGEKIYNNISAEAWELWLAHQTMLINENKLIMTDPKARSFLVSEMEKFFFNE